MKSTDRKSSRPQALLSSLSLLALATAMPAFAATETTAQPVAEATTTVDEIEIVAERRDPDAAIGEIKPDLQLSTEDVAAYGVSTMADLVEQLNPQLTSNAGRGEGGPAILINGRRVSGFNEIRNLPTEAIQRVDLLPEEAALTYGFAANQRVMNIVLKPLYSSKTAEATAGSSTAGGGGMVELEGTLTRITGDKRFNLSFEYDRDGMLFESDRNLLPLSTDPTLDLAGRTLDQRSFRTLSGKSRELSLNAVYTQPIFANIGATVNATLETTDRDSFRGLPDISLTTPGGLTIDRLVTDYGPLARTSQDWTGHLGVSLNRDVAGWRMSLTGNYDHSKSDSENDADVDATALQAAVTAGAVIVTPTGVIPASLLALRAADTGSSVTDSGSAQFVASRALFDMPAGRVRTSFRGGVSTSQFSSESLRSGRFTEVDFSRTTSNLQANMDVPLTSRSRGVLGALGDISLNTNIEMERISGYGTLNSIGYGVFWSPFRGLTLFANRLHDENAPSQQQLGGAIVTTTGVRIYDYATGQTVDVTQISGGNPNLTNDERERTSFRVTWQPFQSQQLTFRADYNQQRYKNVIGSFPAITAEIQQAFADRFTRDANGDLIQIDLRPVNFARQNVTTLRWGFDYSRPIGPQRGQGGGGQRPEGQQPRAEGQRQAQGAQAGQGGQAQGRGAQGGPGVVRGPGGPGGPQAGPGGGIRFGGGPGGGGFGGGGRGGGGAQDGRLRFSLFHTFYFDDEYLLRPAGPLLDFLDGASRGSGGGRPQSEIQAQINVAQRGLGGELSGTWREGTRVEGGVGAFADDLEFSSLLRVNARVFVDFNRRPEVLRTAPWLKDSRLTLSVSNLFDERQEVTDAAGVTPYSFQPFLIDPMGRTWRASFRKTF